MKSHNSKCYLLLMVIMLIALPFKINGQKILITEFLAVNSNGITDEDLENSDWIEIYNNTDSVINLSGWYLTDDSIQIKKWQFPSIALQKNSYLLIFASGKNRLDPTGKLHTNFKLSGSGEFLAIAAPDSSIVHAYQPLFPAQRTDVSFGLFHQQWVFFSSPTPGAENLAGNLPFAPEFSTTRGFFDNAFDLTLSTPDGTGKIYYTTNGTRPSATTGTLYSSALRIAKTTPLSAVTVNDAGISSEIVTHSYIFPADVLTQPTNPAGYPTNWKKATSSTAIPTDYQMDPDVVNDPLYKNLMVPSLKSIPSVHLVTNIGYLFSDVENATTGGIYIFTGKPSGVGVDWVRPTSAEYFDPSTQKTFQLNCQLKLHGGNSRNPANAAKHGFELVFKSSYGPSKLNFDLFEEKQSAKVHNSLILRSGYNYSWNLLNNTNANQRVQAQYIQDSWVKDTQIDMGHPSGHEKFVHLYINGLYWGMYNIAEDYSDDLMEEYFGGNKLDYDIIKEQQYLYPNGKATAGNFDAFKNMVDQLQATGISTNTNYQKVQGKNPDGTINASYPNLFDPDNYIDYMLINYYVGNLDWNKNNWCVARNRVTNDAPFRFFAWDGETTMTGISINTVNAETTSTNPAHFIKTLIKNPDFKVKFADKVQKHLINTGGELTPTEAAKRYNKFADEIELPIVAESARWGDCSGTLYTRDAYWTPRRQALLDSYFPFRADTVIMQLKKAAYLPDVNAPVFSHPAGNYENAFSLQISAEKGTIYYTLDGKDPRQEMTGMTAAGAVAFTTNIPINQQTFVRARIKTDTDWSAITEATYLIDTVSSNNEFMSNKLLVAGYPNPFSNETQISVQLPVNGDLNISIYHIDGRLVENLFDGIGIGGQNNFNWNADNQPSGIYICRFNFAGKNSFIKLMKK